MVEVIMMMMLVPNGNFPSPPLLYIALASRSSASRTAPSSSTWEGRDLRWVSIIITTTMRSCCDYKNHNQVLWHTLGQFPQSRLGRLHDCPRFQKVSANLTIFEIQIFNTVSCRCRPTAMLEICDRYILADSEFFFDRSVFDASTNSEQIHTS